MACFRICVASAEPEVEIFERLGEIAQSLMTTATEIHNLRESLTEVRQTVRELEADFHDLRERLVRLETSRDADRSHMETEISRFKLEVERAELRHSRALPAASTLDPPTAPEQ
jgi:regulator of replication initiation timing